jgi:hypothetical protein
MSGSPTLSPPEQAVENRATPYQGKVSRSLSKKLGPILHYPRKSTSAAAKYATGIFSSGWGVFGKICSSPLGSKR